jgi:hypothetical protein
MRPRKTQAFNPVAQEIDKKITSRKQTSHAGDNENLRAGSSERSRKWKTLTAHSSDTRCGADDQVESALYETLAQITGSNRDNTGNRIESKENMTGLLPTSRKQILCGEENIQHQN